MSDLIDDVRWAALIARDPAADFIYAVRTTGVYCRPGCASRPPRREHVALFADGAAAQRAGYRPCKRCRPDAPADADRRALVARVCGLIAAAETPPRLADLAAAVALSPAHLQRIFTAAVGLSPRAYAAGLRRARLQAGLAAEPSVTDAMLAAGYSSARLYAEPGGALGMPPSRFRAGAPGERIRATVAPCDLGHVLVAATDRGICTIELADAPAPLWRLLRERFPHAELQPDDAGFAGWVAQVVALIGAPAAGLDLPLDIRGSAFQAQVWDALRAIPPGATLSYAALAARVGRPRAARAVAQACAANQLAVAIPCHRITRGDGGLGGYRWGLARKRALLDRER